MTAYVVSQTRPIDADRTARYRELAAPSVAAHGGRYVARATAVEVLEDDLPDTGEWGLTLIAFASVEAARAWYASPEYAEALAVRRDGALERRLCIVDALD